ncbi:MAG: hypothetical protein ACRDOE_09305, partial [Streptosporangiaceae bacterium]
EAAVRAVADEQVAALRAGLLAAQPPHPSRIFDLVFANPPAALLRERDEMNAALEPGGDA